MTPVEGPAAGDDLQLQSEGMRMPVTPEALIKGWIATAMFVDGSLGWWNDSQGI